MSIPLKKFKSYVKQIDTTALSPLQRMALDSALPHFRSAEIDEDFKVERQLEGKKRFLESHRELADYLPSLPEWQSVPNRRFSGGPDLSRGRYYSLCKDESGDDGLTLAAEMRAYRSVRKSALCTVLDLLYPLSDGVMGMLDLPGGGIHSLALVFVGGPGLVNPFIERLKEFSGEHIYGRRADQQSSTCALAVTIPYRVDEVEIQQVLDLRDLRTQEWFFETFSANPKEVYVTFDSAQDVDFTDLLPWIMNMEFGGSGFTEGVGHFLRRNGVDALIYPSARTDASAIQCSGRLVSWKGWCLVDYRGAPDRAGIALVDVTEQTPFPFGGTTRILHWPSGLDKGSWAVEGVSETYRWRFFNELENTIGQERSRRLILLLRLLEGDTLRFAV
jgi:hypothetical protein